jgi:hypothetical protein
MRNKLFYCDIFSPRRFEAQSGAGHALRANARNQGVTHRIRARELVAKPTEVTISG